MTKSEGQRPATVPSGPAPNTRQVRVLVADDNHDQVLALVTLLRQEGYEARGAHNGIDALRVMSVFDPDAAVLDIDMPGMDGYQVARAIRERSHRRPLLIASTAHAGPEDEAMAKIAGFDHHLAKPFGAERLLRLLEPLRSPRSPAA